MNVPFSFDVRRAVSDDLVVLKHIEDQCVNSHNYSIYHFRQSLELYKDVFFVATHHKQVVGYCIGGYQQTPKRGWILAMATHPDYIRRGIATRLLEQTLIQLAQMGYARVRLTVAPSNEAALTLYTKFEFSRVDYVENYFGDGEHRLILEKQAS
jgi:ribosomal-protein-alanine N-acetyltransferase